MKITIIEIEGMESSDLSLLVQSQRVNPVLTESPPVVLETPPAPPVVDMAPTPKGWRPRAAKRKAPAERKLREYRPETPKKYQCSSCGADAEGEYKRVPRLPCPKCNSTAWELVPAHGSALEE